MSWTQNFAPALRRLLTLLSCTNKVNQLFANKTQTPESIRQLHNLSKKMVQEFERDNPDAWKKRKFHMSAHTGTNVHTIGKVILQVKVWELADHASFTMER
jgi:hypothetical protein